MREESSVEDKVGLFFKFLYDRWIKYATDVFKQMALIDGMQPEYAQIYGDFASGMVVESVATVVITGLKSASGLSKGFTSEGDVIAGSGIWNVNKGGSKTNVVEVEISRSNYPESAKHIEDAIANGQPDILTINRDGAKPNRKASIKGIDKVPGKDLDEYPLAMFKE